MELLFYASERSRARTHADHWAYLFVRGEVVARLVNEHQQTRELFAKWTRAFDDALFRVFGGGVTDEASEAAQEATLARITAMSPPEAYQCLLTALCDVARIAIPDAIRLVNALRLPCACLALDVWQCALVMLGIRAGIASAPVGLPIGGRGRARLPSQPFSFSLTPGESPEQEQARLMREFTRYRMTPVALPGFRRRVTPGRQDKLRRWCEWYYRRRVEGASERSLAREYKVDRSTLAYGVKELEKLFGLSRARIRPPAENPGAQTGRFSAGAENPGAFTIRFFGRPKSD